jgi:predicted RNase H-like HicB family nuclease
MGTTRNSKGCAARHGLDRPFPPQVAAQARQAAARYRIVVWFDDEEQEFYGRGVEIPLAMGDGMTADECVRAVRQAMTAVVSLMLERGQRPPTPLSQANRTEQINIRLTRQERYLVEQAAKAGGHRGVSDYVRAKVLAA